MEAFFEASETEVFFWSGVLVNEYREEKLGPRNFGGLTLAAHHVPKSLYQSHSINRTEGRKYDKKLMGQDKDRGHQLLSWAKQA